MIARAHCVKSNPPQGEDPEGVPISNHLRTQSGEGAPAHLKSFVVALFPVSDLRVGDAAAQLDELNAVSLAEPKGVGARS